MTKRDSGTEILQGIQEVKAYKAGQLRLRTHPLKNPAPAKEIKQQTLPSDSLQAMVKRVQRLGQTVTALETRRETYFSITRLTTVKGLCATHVAALEFVLFLAQRTRERMRTTTPSKALVLQKPKQYLFLADQAIRGDSSLLKDADAR